MDMVRHSLLAAAYALSMYTHHKAAYSCKTSHCIKKTSITHVACLYVRDTLVCDSQHTDGDRTEATVITSEKIGNSESVS